MQNRRKFLATSVAIAGGVMASRFYQEEATKHLKSFGVQLYSVRDLIEKDPKNTLKQLAAMGYKQVESFERSQGMFWGMTNKAFKSFLDDLGMKIISSHFDPNIDLDKKAE